MVNAINFASMFGVDEFCLWVETLQRRVLVIAVDRAMSDSAIFEILDEVRGEEALSDSAFAVDDEVDLFVHVKVRWFRGCEDRRRAVPRVRERSAGSSVRGGGAIVCAGGDGLVTTRTAARRRPDRRGGRCSV